MTNIDQIEQYLMDKYGTIDSYCIDGKYWLYSEDTSYSSPRYVSREIDNDYTEISFEFFSKNILKSNKDMNKKQNFSISGSLALKKAFVEEVGLPTLSQNSVNTNLTAWDSGKGLQGGALVPSSGTVLFNLPEDWDKALEYVKEYFKEELKFKVGDWVIGWHSDYNNYKNKPWKINKIKNCSREKIGLIPENDSQALTYSNNVRLVTPEEIKSIQTKTITIGDTRILFTISKGKIVADGTEFSITDWRNIKYKMSDVANLHKYSVTFPTVKVGCTTITLDEVNLIIDTYNKLND